MSNRKKLSPLRKALASKSRASAFHLIRVVAADVAEAAEARLEEAVTAAARQLRAAELAEQRGAVDVADLRTAAAAAVDARDAALAERDECYYRIELQALDPADYDALVAAHPPKEGQKGSHDILEMRYPLIAASVVDGDVTGEEWRAEHESGRWTDAEINALAIKCEIINNQAPDFSSPKGSAAMPGTPPAWRTAGPAASPSRSS